MADKIWLIAYDITCDRRRYRVAKCLEDNAFRLQHSVFACQGSNAAMGRLAGELSDHCDPADGDDIQILPLAGPDAVVLARNPLDLDGVSGPVAEAFSQLPLPLDEEQPEGPESWVV